MNPNSSQESPEGYVKIIAADTENAFLDYDDTANPDPTGKYRCRDCGKLFDTLEEHDRHRREEHRQEKVVPLVGMPM